MFLKCLWLPGLPHQMSPRCSQDVRQDLPKCENVPKMSPRCFKMFQDASECFKMFQDVSRCFKMFQDVSRCPKMSQDVPKISQDVPTCSQNVLHLQDVSQNVSAIPRPSVLQRNVFLNLHQSSSNPPHDYTEHKS